MRSLFDPGSDGTARSVQEVYAHQTPPLLPSGADQAAHEEALDLSDTPLDVLMLGATPAVYGLPWPSGSSVRAVDRSLPMIEHVWPGPAGAAVLGEWTQLPFPDAQFDRVVCDGGLAFFGPLELDGVRDEVARVLRPGGLFVVRLYSWSRKETMDQVISDVASGSVSTANEMRLRSWSALQTSIDDGVLASIAYDAVIESVGTLERLVECAGLEDWQFIPFVASAQSAARYTMWPVDELVARWAGGDRFEFAGMLIPEHHLGQLCPVLAFRRTDTA